MQVNRIRLWYASQPRAFRVLLAINVVLYLAWNLVGVYIGGVRSFVIDHVALNPDWPGILFEPWQLLTYAFLHLSPGLGGLLHILFNMAWMLWVGGDYEVKYGPGRILGAYLLGAIGGALLTVALHALFPSFGPFGGPVHGASGAVLALMTMVAVHQPHERIGLMFIGVVRLIHVVIGFLVLDILFLSSGGTSVSAHLGGVLTGYLLGKRALEGKHPTPWADAFFPSRSSFRSRSDQGMLQRMEAWLADRNAGNAENAAADNRGSIRTQPSDGKGLDPEAEIDRILDKISAHGYDALTEEEKRRLVDTSGDA